MNKLYIAGVGPGSLELVSPKALNVIEDSDVLIGGRRNLDTFKKYGKEEIEIRNNLESIVKYINENIEKRKITVLASGDPYMYGIAHYINSNINMTETETISGISSIQYLAAKVDIKWDDMCFTSIHGRDSNILNIISNNYKVGLFTGKEPESILKLLCNNGYGRVKVIAGENLSYLDEKITIGYADKLCNIKFSDLSVFILIKEFEDKLWKYNTCGIPDDLFVRGSVPMTKEEIRAISISKLRLKADSKICDIGSGTGSIAVECALFSPFGNVYAYERNIKAIKLIKENSIKFGVNNIKIIEGDISQTLVKNFLQCDRAFIGGSGGNLDFVIKKLTKNINIRVVINSVTIETTYEAMKSLDKNGYKNIECICVSISRSEEAGTKHIMKALNPVYIISGDFEKKQIGRC